MRHSYGKRTLDMIAELNDYNVANKRLLPQLVWSVQSFNMYNLANSRITADEVRATRTCSHAPTSAIQATFLGRTSAPARVRTGHSLSLSLSPPLSLSLSLAARPCPRHARACRQLLSDLKNTSRDSIDRGSPGSTIKSAAASAVLGSRASDATSSFVLESLFRSVQLVPVRRPHAEDEVVANLANYPSSQLSASYLHDADALREATLRSILPAHHCHADASVPLFPKRCGTEPFTGPQLVEQIRIWLKYGHIVDPSESAEAANETLVLAEFEAAHDAWFQRECARLNQLLRTKLRDGYQRIDSKARGVLNETALAHVGDEAIHSVLGFVKHLPRKSMARGIELSTFWQVRSRASYRAPGRCASYGVPSGRAARGAVLCACAIARLGSRRRSPWMALCLRPRAGARMLLTPLPEPCREAAHSPTACTRRATSQYPSKVATYIESAGKTQTTQCAEELFQARRTAEGQQRATGRAAAARKVTPPGTASRNGSAPLKIVKRSESVRFEKVSNARLARVRARSKQLAGADLNLEHQLGKAREECFVVFD